MSQTEFAVEGDGWGGHVTITTNPGVMGSAQIWVESTISGDVAIAGLEYLLQLIAAGRSVRFRVRPEVHKEQGFGEQRVGWRGCARFEFTTFDPSKKEFESHAPDEDVASC